jgi:hypothetical protein
MSNQILCHVIIGGPYRFTQQAHLAMLEKESNVSQWHTALQVGGSSDMWCLALAST